MPSPGPEREPAMDAPPRPERVLRRPVWSARLRALHWAMALCVAVLLATGWLFAAGFGAPDYGILDTHRATGYVLAAVLLGRVVLLVGGRGPERWADSVPRGVQRAAAGATLVFYLSLGRAPLPAWYAHNPLWGPVYLAWFALMLATAASGILRSEGLHGSLATVVGVLAGLHVAAVVVHDWRGGSADVSAMLNGARIFAPRSMPAEPRGASVDVRLEAPARPARGAPE